MNGDKFFIDTNICIYLLDGDEILAELLQDQEIYISLITEIELFAFHGNDQNSVNILNSFIQSVTVLNITEDIKLQTISIRKTSKLKIPDSIIAASALASSLTLITADKAFKKVIDLDLILYEKS